MVDCFFRVANKLDCEAENLEKSAGAPSRPDDIRPDRLRRLAADIRADCRPCIRYPACGCRPGFRN